MHTIYIIIFFIFGLFFGSFLTVVGQRLPRKENFITTRSYCDNCKHQLSFLDMIPVVSYYLLNRKCRYCKKEIDSLSTYMEMFTGVLFALSYYVFGFSYNLLISLGIVCMLIIISVSDIAYYIIPDELLVFFSIYFLIIYLINNGIIDVLLRISSGIALFSIMYLIYILGNILFKKESLGGGDIKMMFVFGLIIDPILGILCIFISSFLALPISLNILRKRNQKLVPFGPFLLISLLLVFATKITYIDVLNFLKGF